MKRAQLELAQDIILGLVLVGTFAVVGYKITAGLASGETSGSAISNATTDVESAYNEITTNLSTVALVGIFTIVIAMVMVMKRAA